jgi:hypothetical protein
MGRIRWSRMQLAGCVGTVLIESIKLGTDWECRAFSRATRNRGGGNLRGGGAERGWQNQPQGGEGEDVSHYGFSHRLVIGRKA